MRPLFFVLVMSLFASIATHPADAQPQEWDLLQNNPNPFCGVTTIEFHVPQTAEVYLTVMSPDSSMVVKTLVAGLFSAGYHTIVWDQADDEGITVPNGVYPYNMNAGLPELKGILFDSWLEATVSCGVPNERESWGRVKSRYHF